MKYYLAIDIGASSGRHIVGWEENGEIREILRFQKDKFLNVENRYAWKVRRLYSDTFAAKGLELAKERQTRILQRDAMP